MLATCLLNEIPIRLSFPFIHLLVFINYECIVYACWIWCMGHPNTFQLYGPLTNIHSILSERKAKLNSHIINILCTILSTYLWISLDSGWNLRPLSRIWRPLSAFCRSSNSYFAAATHNFGSKLWTWKKITNKRDCKLCWYPKLYQHIRKLIHYCIVIRNWEWKWIGISVSVPKNYAF